MSEQLHLEMTDDQQIELYLRAGYSQVEITTKGYDPVLVAQVANRLPATLDIDRICY